MKLENIERAYSDAKLKISQMTERVQELTRDCGCLKDELAAANDRAARHQSESSELADRMKVLEAERAGLASRLHESAAGYEAQLAEVEDRRRSSIRALEEKVEDQRKLILELQSELASTASRVKTEGDTSKELENYKKRAQLALKKVRVPLVSVTHALYCRTRFDRGL